MSTTPERLTQLTEIARANREAAKQQPIRTLGTEPRFLDRLAWSAYDNIPHGIAIFNRLGLVEFRNPALDESAEASVVRTVQAVTTDSEGQPTLSLLESAQLNPGTVYPAEINTNDDRWYKLTVSSTQGLNGQISGRTLVTAVDITEEKQREAELLRQREELVAARSEQEQYIVDLNANLATSAHDMKTPLTYMKGVAQLILRQPDCPREKIDAFLQAVSDGVSKLNGMINDEVERAKANTLLKKEVVVISDVLQTAYLELTGEIRQQGIEADFTSLPIDYEVMGDPDKLTSVVRILMTNAIQAMKGSSVKRLTITHQTVKGQLSIHVVDTGNGIPAEIRKEIFEGLTTKRGTEQNGTGFGLATARRMAQRHGGNLHLLKSVTAKMLEKHPEYGQTGTTFALTLPLFPNAEG